MSMLPACARAIAARAQQSPTSTMMHSRRLAPQAHGRRCTAGPRAALLPKHKLRERAWRRGEGSAQRRRAVVAEHSAVQAPVSDQTVPEGHASLHASLYGQGGAEDEHRTSDYSLRQGEDDGTEVVPLAQWLERREGEKPLGVYGVYDAQGQLQYIGYSRNMVTTLRGHVSRVGAERASTVRAMVFANRSMATREHLEREVVGWVERFAGGQLPAGNGPERELWEGAPRVLTDAERAEYADKAAKLKRAMGDVKAGDAQPPSSPEQIRQEWKNAVEGGDWSAVIDKQTSEAVGGGGAAAPSASSSSSSSTTSAGNGGGAAPAAAGGGSGPLVSPFMQPSVHRKIGDGAGGGGGNGGGNGGDGGRGAGGGGDVPPRGMDVQSVDAALNEVRPYLVADGGDVEVVEVSGGRVFLRLQGTCTTCASQSSTMKMGIERALKAAFGEQLLEVVQLDKVDVVTATADNVDRHLDMLRGAIRSFGGKVEVAEVQAGRAVVKYKGPPAIGKGVSAAIRERFPEIREVVLADF